MWLREKPRFTLIDSYRATTYSVQMFVTRPQFSKYLPPFPGYEDCDAWGAVEIPTQMPLVLVHVNAAAQAETEQHVSYLFGLYEQVNQFLDELPDSASIIGMHLVRPAWCAGKTSWRMDELAAVWTCLAPSDNDLEVGLFETLDGEFLTDPLSAADPMSVVKEREIYRRRAAK